MHPLRVIAAANIYTRISRTDSGPDIHPHVARGKQLKSLKIIKSLIAYWLTSGIIAISFINMTDNEVRARGVKKE